MNPESSAKIVLAVTRSKAKMYEYLVPEEDHIEITVNPSDLFDLTIGILGNLSSLYDINSNFAQGSPIAFSAHFFDAFINSRLNPDFNPYLFLIGSAAYYLCDMPGNSAVLAKKLPESFDLGANELDEFLRLLLMYKIDQFAISVNNNPYKVELQSLVIHLKKFFSTGEGKQRILQVLESLKEKAYAGGSDRELLFTDIIRAVIFRMIRYSVWSCLPIFSGVPTDKWRDAIKKETFIRELWPSQFLLGQKDVLSGSSAIVSRSTAKIWASKRKIPVVKVGRLLRVRPEALEEYIKRNSEWKRVVTGTQCQNRPKRPPKTKSFDSYVERVKTEKSGEAEESI